jgi:hypothetical protein
VSEWLPLAGITLALWGALFLIYLFMTWRDGL